MQFQISLAAWVSLFSLAMAQGVSFTEWPSELKHGEPATMKWSGDPSALTTITLRKGPAGNLHDFKILTAEGKNNAFTWTPNDDLPTGEDYALRVAQGDSVNYSGIVKVSNGTSEIPPSKGPAPPQSSNKSEKDDDKKHDDEDDKKDDDKKDDDKDDNDDDKPLDTSPAASQKQSDDDDDHNDDDGDSAAPTSTSELVSTPPATPHSIEKNKVTSQAQTGDASFQQFSLRWVLGGVAAVFYLLK